MGLLDRVKTLFGFGPEPMARFSAPLDELRERPGDWVPRVLIVDDLMFERDQAKSILREAGFEVVAEAGNGLEGIEKFKETNPDLVLMNVIMPFMSGVDATQKIREIRDDAVVIASDSSAHESVVLGCIEAGAVDFVVRPYMANSLILSAKKALGLSLPFGFEAAVESRLAIQDTNKTLPRLFAVRVIGPAFAFNPETDAALANPVLLARCPAR